jgi:hypothetical protein
MASNYDGGIYGDMLAVFPELVATYTIFAMDARPGGGYGERYNFRQADGIFRRTPGGKMGIVSENRVENEVGSFWTYEDEAAKFVQGTYFEDDGDILVLMKDNNYVREGGYAKFTVALVPSVTDRQVSDTAVIDRALGAF